MSDRVVLGAAVLLCSVLLLFDAGRCLRLGAFQFGCSSGEFFQIAHRRDHPVLYWVGVTLYMAVGMLGMALGATLLLGWV
jgi:hypothetical protein